jgi:hypothetical protein
MLIWFDGFVAIDAFVDHTDVVRHENHTTVVRDGPDWYCGHFDDSPAAANWDEYKAVTEFQIVHVLSYWGRATEEETLSLEPYCQKWIFFTERLNGFLFMLPGFRSLDKIPTPFRKYLHSLFGRIDLLWFVWVSGNLKKKIRTRTIVLFPKVYCTPVDRSLAWVLVEGCVCMISVTNVVW